MLTHEKKFLSAIIDISVVLIVTFVIYLFIPKIDYAKSVTFFIIYAITAFLYFLIYLLISKDSTLGLKIMNLKMVSRDWSKPSKKSILLRSVSYMVPVLYLVNFLYIYINKSDSTFFDEISDSFIAPLGDTYNLRG